MRTLSDYSAKLERAGIKFHPIETYVGALKSIMHRCPVGHEFKALPANIMQGMGCKECANRERSISHEDYCADVFAVHGASIRPEEQYVNFRTRINHKCFKGHTWKGLPNSVLYGHGCPQCNLRHGVYRRKTVVLHNRIYDTLQGGEDVALRYLVLDLRWKHPDLNVPLINYNLEGKQHKYRPDFFYSGTNTIVEVKSPGTMGLTNSKVFAVDSWEKLKAKRQACIEQGYKFKLLVVDRRGRSTRIIKTPRRWFDMSKSDLAKSMECMS